MGGLLGMAPAVKILAGKTTATVWPGTSALTPFGPGRPTVTAFAQPVWVHVRFTGMPLEFRASP